MNRRKFLEAWLAAAALRNATGELSPATNSPLFRDVAEETGLRFHHSNGAAGEYLMPEIMGAGVALIDYDNDGDLDVYLVQGTALEPGRKPLFPPPPGWKPGNRLFRNMLAETGRLWFKDVTEEARVGHVGYGMGVAVGDYDNDGFLDLYVTNFGHSVLYHNNGDGTFSDVTASAGVDEESWCTSATWFDYDGDGNLDLFVCHYVDFTVLGNKRCYAPAGELDYCTPKAYRPVPSRLFRNSGNGRFEDVTESAGLGRSYGPALGVVAADFDGDGRVDLYVANDTAPNNLWLNQGDGTFKDSALELGVALSVDGLPRAGMGVTAGDFENNGSLGLLVTNLAREGATLFRPEGGVYDDVTAAYGLAQPTLPFTGFGTQWFDYDNEGRLDLFIANGAVTLLESQKGKPFPFAQTKQLFHNEGRGRPFSETTALAGPAFAIAEVSRGAAFGDIDNDGAVDIVVTNNNGPVRLLKNLVGAKKHWLEVRLEGAARNRFGIGARVAVLREDGERLWRRAHTDSSYLSANDARVHFGLGDNANFRAVEVHWPGGRRETWQGIRADRIVTLREGSGSK